MNRIVFEWIIAINKAIPVVFGIAAFISRFLTHTNNWQFYLIIGFIFLAIRVKLQED